MTFLEKVKNSFEFSRQQSDDTSSLSSSSEPEISQYKASQRFFNPYQFAGRQICGSEAPSVKSASTENHAKGPPPPYQPAAVVQVEASPVPSPSPSGVVIVQPVQFYGRTSSFITQCPHCRAQIATRCNSTFSMMDIIILLIGLFLFFPLICVVLCCSPWHDYEHFCPNCHRFLGKSTSL
uniref:LITAF domain-containing protein n=1 Tax=Panagrolaimus sp. PS1159 TaxID=55785 RepID=A0AC35FRT0_9BILA